MTCEQRFSTHRVSGRTSGFSGLSGLKTNCMLPSSRRYATISSLRPNNLKRQELRGNHDLFPLRRLHESVGGWLLPLEYCEMQAPFCLIHRA